MGLSPRVRGNLSPRATRSPRSRSIPARAGEPLEKERLGRPLRVYPRACGGTTRDSYYRGLKVGLSPRVRGNLPDPAAVGVPLRSIPAHAGEPGKA